MLLLLRGGSNDGSEACRRKQILCLLCMGAAHRQSYEREAGDKTESTKNLFHGLFGLAFDWRCQVMPGITRQVKYFPLWDAY